MLRFNGEKTDDEGIELLRESLVNTCRTAKLISKQKEANTYLTTRGRLILDLGQ